MDLAGWLARDDVPVTKKTLSVYLLSVLVANNGTVWGVLFFSVPRLIWWFLTWSSAADEGGGGLH